MTEECSASMRSLKDISKTVRGKYWSQIHLWDLEKTMFRRMASQYTRLSKEKRESLAFCNRIDLSKQPSLGQKANP